MNAALRTVKMALEILGGLRQGQSLGAPVVFVQGAAPDDRLNTQLRIGDQWINTTTDRMYYWTGDVWKILQ